MDHLHDGPVHPGVEPDDQQAARQAQDGDRQPHPVAAAPPSLAVADRREQEGSPATDEILLGSGTRRLYQVFSHMGPLPFGYRRRPDCPCLGPDPQAL